MTKKFLRLKDVENITGLKRSSIYLKIQNGDFPSQIKLGERSVAWLESDVQQWINQKIASSKGVL